MRPRRRAGNAARPVGRFGLRALLIAIVLLLVLLAGGVAWLALWNPPAPRSHIETVIPNARFGH